MNRRSGQWKILIPVEPGQCVTVLKGRFTQIRKKKNSFSYLPLAVSNHVDSFGLICLEISDSEWNYICGAQIVEKNSPAICLSRNNVFTKIISSAESSRH